MADRMRRKFSFDIPKLKIAATKTDHRLHQEQLLTSVDSPPVTPKTIRPIPYDLDAELRAACFAVVNNPKPSHEDWLTQHEPQKHAWDYAAVRGGLEAYTSNNPIPPQAVRKTSESSASGKYSYKPDLAVEDLFRQEDAARLASQRAARARAEQLKTAESAPPKVVTLAARAPTESHVPATVVKRPSAPATIRLDTHIRPKMLDRTESAGTTLSTPQTDTTDYPWTTSTGMTSAVVTPARGSKRTSANAAASGSESGSAPRIDAARAEWTRTELERHKRVLEGKEKTAWQATARSTMSDSAHSAAHNALSLSKMPTRKPVPISRPSTRHDSKDRQLNTREREECDRYRPGIRKDSTDVSRPATGQDASELSFSSRRALSGSRTRRPATGQPSTDEERGREITRPDSRLGRASRAASQAASIARSTARKISTDIADHFRPDFPSTTHDVPVVHDRPRSSSRSRKLHSQARDAGRPPSSMSRRKYSTDADSSASRAHSIDSPSEPARPGSSLSWTRPIASLRDLRASPLGKKSIPNLNRELPPLPSLDNWQKEVSARSIPLTSVFSRRTKTANNQADAPSDDWESHMYDTTSTEEKLRLSRPTTNIMQRHGFDEAASTYSASSVSGWVSPLSEADYHVLHTARRVQVNTAAHSSSNQLRSQQSRTKMASPFLGRNVSSQSSRPSERKVHIAQARKESTHDQDNTLRARLTHATGGSMANVAAYEEKPKRKWWKSKQKRADEWDDGATQNAMDHDNPSPDEPAGAPIVRY